MKLWSYTIVCIHMCTYIYIYIYMYIHIILYHQIPEYTMIMYIIYIYIYIYIHIYIHIHCISHSPSLHLSIRALRVDPRILPGGNAILGVDEVPGQRRAALTDLVGSWWSPYRCSMATFDDFWLLKKPENGLTSMFFESDWVFDQFLRSSTVIWLFLATFRRFADEWWTSSRVWKWAQPWRSYIILALKLWIRGAHHHIPSWIDVTIGSYMETCRRSW